MTNLSDVKRGLTVISGCKSSGKTEMIIKIVRQAKYAKARVMLFAPYLEELFQGNMVVTHDGTERAATMVDPNNPREILNVVDSSTDIVCIDEAQFMGPALVECCLSLLDRGVSVVVAGLNLDFKAEPFGPMPELLAYADTVVPTHAVCKMCGSEFATRTQRLVDGWPAGKETPLIMVGDKVTYEARCRSCYVRPL